METRSSASRSIFTLRTLVSLLHPPKSMFYSRTLRAGQAARLGHLARPYSSTTQGEKPSLPSFRRFTGQVPKFLGKLLLFTMLGTGISYGLGRLAMNYHLERLSPTPETLSKKARGFLRSAYLYDAVNPDLLKSQNALLAALTLAEAQLGPGSVEVTGIRVRLAQLAARVGKFDAIPTILLPILPVVQEGGKDRLEEACDVIALLADAYLKIDEPEGEERAREMVEWVLAQADPLSPSSPSRTPGAARCLLLAAQLAGRQERWEDARWLCGEVRTMVERESTSFLAKRARRASKRNNDVVFGEWWREMNRLPREVGDPESIQPWACLDARTLALEGTLSLRETKLPQERDAKWEEALEIARAGQGQRECDICLADLSLKMGEMAESKGELDVAMQRYQEAFGRASDARALFMYVRANEGVKRVGTGMQRAVDAAHAMEEVRIAEENKV
ncbi:hypothetical protein BJ684DRAFT_17011 [Piptocephalis cylindrospora]|uniref:Uncharacterized protein n=1 Tax=Piptocephalis cylindrospora TaxID=1907219 RepID=A0A4P9Y105_9FUNG|nr:hypothetical protein BJ684DRAFT_17011 [Piptocephalis cylindrospora]|eukprot:RKP12506.1 hypothetical protein BJ684DRAFT_17011 [Piptocephalis cylindrospora]